MTAAQKLAALIAEAAARRGRGQRGRLPNDQVAALVAELGADPDEKAIERFFELLARELRSRGATLPPVEQLPPSVAPLLAAASAAFDAGPGGEPDLDAAVDRMDDAMARTLGTSPRQVERDRLRDEIRRDIAKSVADSVRRHGLVPNTDDKS
jgi:hypothetical protein